MIRSRNILMMVLVAICLVTLSASVDDVAARNSAFPSQLNLISGHSGQCLDVAWEEVNKNGARVQQWTCYGVKQKNQIWHLVPVDDRYFQIKSMQSGKCLDVARQEVNNNGARVQQWTCYGAEQANQMWSLIPMSGGYQIRSKESGKCLDVPWEIADKNGARVQQWTCYDNEGSNRHLNQRWLVQVP